MQRHRVPGAPALRDRPDRVGDDAASAWPSPLRAVATESRLCRRAASRCSRVADRSRGTSPAADTAAANEPKWCATLRALGQSPSWYRGMRHSWPSARARTGSQSAMLGTSP